MEYKVVSRLNIRIIYIVCTEHCVRLIVNRWAKLKIKALSEEYNG